MRTLLNSLLLSCVALCNGQHNHSAGSLPNNETFNLIKGLVGKWQGTYKWIGTSNEGKMKATYYLTGNGSAVVENLIQGGKITMTSIYHMDGNDLRLTHFCGAGNQPRLKAQSTNENRSVKFQFVDITNLTNRAAGHVTSLEIKFKDDNRLTLIFTFSTAGVESYELIELSRYSG